MKIILVAFLFLMPVHAYKFLCNGTTAESEQESDNCPEPCTDSTATRWPNKTIQYNIDISVLASGVSASDWTSVVIESFDAWAQTPGGGLIATYVGVGVRSFGTDSENQDIFFVISETEWMKRVGAAADGVLGVTLPPYYCPTSQISYRRIDDADMIINGVPSSGFKWAKNCSGKQDCQPLFGTVAHESGHALGLGHPCVDCAVLMSAQAAYPIEYPLFDDQEGLRALYPGTFSGALGSACASDAQCSSSICHPQGSNQYCSQKCTNTCSNNMVCLNNLCEFPSVAAALHELCTTQKPCDSGLSCVGVDESSRYCFMDCTDSQTCQDALETCHQLKSDGVKINAYACIKMVKQGESCGQTIVCQTGLTCTAGICAVGSSGSSSGNSCSSVKPPTEIWLLLALLGMLVHRPKKKC